MWYDKAIRVYEQREEEGRKRRAVLLKNKFMACFGESIDPVCGVYQLEYEGKQIIVYIHGSYLYMVRHGYKCFWYVSLSITDANMAGNQLLLVDHWAYPHNLHPTVFGDLLYAYPEYKICCV